MALHSAHSDDHYPTYITFDMTNGLGVWTIYKVIHISLLLFVHCNKNN